MTEIDPNDPLFEELSEAISGTYHAAPNGEGVYGSLYFAARAAFLVCRGAKAPEAVASAIGHVGTYGVRRKYGLIPLPEAIGAPGNATLMLRFSDEKTRDEAILGIEPTLPMGELNLCQSYQNLRSILLAILDSDERGQGTPFMEAMEAAAKALGRNPSATADNDGGKQCNR